MHYATLPLGLGGEIRKVFRKPQALVGDKVLTNARLCKTVLDRLTDQAHIIEAGMESHRLRRTLRKKTRE
jgi:hypothetical protein